MRLRGVNKNQLKVDSNLNNRPRAFMTQSIYYKPKDVSLKKSNQLLYTFAFTRHPFRRLVSAYHDKLIMHQNKLKGEIMSKIGKLYPRNSNDYPIPKMFVNYLLDEAKQHGPIFLNWHFRPQYAVCPFCVLSFDYIGEIEDMDTHTKYLAKRFGFPVI